MFDYNGEEKFLSWVDYLIFALTLLTSFLVGGYFGFSKNKARTTEEYLIGGKSVTVLPIALSLIATSISGNTLLAVPADIYKFGSNYVWTILGDLIAFLLTLFIFLPIFFNLQLVSIFEYLELRFDKHVRRLSSILNLCATLFYAPIVLYIPSLAFSQVSGISIHAITIVVSLICTIYTTVGGFKAVVWTDALQFSMMMGSVIAVLSIGAKSVGGLREAIVIATHGKRWEIFDFSFDLTSRSPLWGPLFGHLFFALSTVTVNQSCIQKYMGLKTFSDVRRCLYIHFVGMFALKLIALLIGNTIYARYAHCDVFRSHKITKIDQLVPYFVMDLAGNIPGLPGLFFAGIFSAALSSLSSSLNAAAATIHSDLILPFISENTTHKRNTNIMKAIVAILGVLSILLVLVVERVGGLFPFTTSLQGIVGGPIVGIFILGVLFPSANGKGTLVGGILGVVVTAWIALGNTIYKTKGLLPSEEKPMSMEKCSIHGNYTDERVNKEEDIFVFYKISFWYYAAISTLTVVIVGLLVSLLIRHEKSTVNKNLVSPIVHSYLKKSLDSTVYYNVKTTSDDVNDHK